MKKLASIWARVPDTPVDTEPTTKRTKLILIAIIFTVACLFRYYHYLDLAPLVKFGRQDFSGITAIHDGFASNILVKGTEAVFPSEWERKTDTSLIVYPPGYAIMMAAVYYINGRDPVGLQFVQAILGALAAVLVFLIALQLFNRATALIAGLVVAVSHHLAYFSLLLLPDGVAPVLVLLGTHLFVRGTKIGWSKDRGYEHLFAAGLCFGLSCWFRADALLVWIFLAAALILTRKYLVQPMRRAFTIVMAMTVAIAPLTIRNYLIYEEFIPVSLGTGVVLQAGIADADPSLDLPFKDEDTMRWEMKFYNQSEYGRGLMTPDGIFREKERTRRALKVIIDRPLWYLGVMAGRFDTMMKYSAHAPLIRMQLPGDFKEAMEEYQSKHGTVRGTLHYYIDRGSAIDILRPVLRAVQRIFKEGLFPLLLIGLLLGLKNRRLWILLAAVPAYYLLSHSAMHVEFRYVLSAHYLLFVFYALAFYTIFVVLPRQLRDALRLPDYAGKLDAEPFNRMGVPANAQLSEVGNMTQTYEGSSVRLDTGNTNTTGDTEGTAPLSFEYARQRLAIGGVDIDNFSKSETLRLIDRFVQTGGPRMMTVVNASKLVLAQQDEELKNILIGSDIVTADGMSVVWAARLLGGKLKSRVTGIDTFRRTVALAARRNYSVYFLGAKPEVVEAVAFHYRKKYPKLRIAGYHNGYFGSNEEVIEDIKKAQPDILFVAMGSPRQEKWMAACLPVVRVPFAIGVGGSFDHVAGFQKRAPQWMQRAGLEWLYRLLQEPGRLWKRYLIGNTLFILLVLRQRFGRK